MNLSSSIFSDVLSPLAAFVDVHDPDFEADLSADDGDQFGDSVLNPKNRVDCLAPKTESGWRLDGIDVDGQRFFAVPNFALNAPPLRIDVYIPPVEEHPSLLRAMLESDLIMQTSGNSAIALPISQHVLRGLDEWSCQMPDFATLYFGMPFGSQILLTALVLSPAEMDFHLIPNYEAEQAMLSMDTLTSMWNLPNSAWPEVIDFAELRYQRQLHEAITLVHIPAHHGRSDAIFKSLTRGQKHVYNELKMLLTLPPHPNIIRRPRYIVTRKCNFGGKQGVCGFILEYYPLGSLQARLSHTSAGSPPPISNSECFRWAQQITQALVHINEKTFGFYPDLKLDNVLLQESSSPERIGQLDAVLLDLEQRGGWFSWSPPEVAYVEYLEILASRLENHDVLRAELSVQLNTYMPDWSLFTQHDRYTDVDGGFSRPWLALANGGPGGRLRGMLERAQVFMLGKFIWCLFERQPYVRCGIDHELLKDHARDLQTRLVFPEFRITPPKLRELVHACTLGAPEWNDRRPVVALQAGKISALHVFRADISTQKGFSSARETREVVKTWWATEIGHARDFMREVLGGGKQQEGSLLDMAMARPTLTQVLTVLKQIEDASVGVL